MKKIALLIVLVLASSCRGRGQMTYYWHKDGYGADQFGRDHAFCMNKADWYPFGEMQAPGAPELLNLRPKFYDTKGVWAAYIPYQGAQPIYTNYELGDNTVMPGRYNDCMIALGYVNKYKTETRPDVGVLYCDSANCTRSDYENGEYQDTK